MINELLMIISLLASFAVVMIATKLGKYWLYAIPPAFYILVATFTITLIDAFGITTSLGVPMYAAIFLATDIIAENYGKQAARRVVWMGFGAGLALVGFSQLTILVTPAAGSVAMYEATGTLFATTPRFVAASLLAYLISQQWDIFAFHKLKDHFKGKHLWLRNNLSTMSSQLIDSVLFIGLAFYGIIDGIVGFAISIWVGKVLVAVLDTPMIYWSKKILK